MFCTEKLRKVNNSTAAAFSFFCPTTTTTGQPPQHLGGCYRRTRRGRLAAHTDLTKNLLKSIFIRHRLKLGRTAVLKHERHTRYSSVPHMPWRPNLCLQHAPCRGDATRPPRGPSPRTRFCSPPSSAGRFLGGAFLARTRRPCSHTRDTAPVALRIPLPVFVVVVCWMRQLKDAVDVDVRWGVGGGEEKQA